MLEKDSNGLLVPMDLNQYYLKVIMCILTLKFL